jgi:hypothetical protein
MYRWLVNPFCARDVKRFMTDFNLLFTALEMTLYQQPNKEIGRHFFMSCASPFFGIIFIIELLKLAVREPLRKTVAAYL